MEKQQTPHIGRGLRFSGAGRTSFLGADFCSTIESPWAEWDKLIRRKPEEKQVSIGVANGQKASKKDKPWGPSDRSTLLTWNAVWGAGRGPRSTKAGTLPLPAYVSGDGRSWRNRRPARDAQSVVGPKGGCWRAGKTVRELLQGRMSAWPILGARRERESTPSHILGEVARLPGTASGLQMHSARPASPSLALRREAEEEAERGWYDW